MPKGLKIIKAQGNPMTIHQWRRNSRSDYDDILTGFQRNEDLGWYKEVIDPNGQQKAMEMYRNNGVDHYDWAYHDKKYQTEDLVKQFSALWLALDFNALVTWTLYNEVFRAADFV